MTEKEPQNLEEQISKEPLPKKQYKEYRFIKDRLGDEMFIGIDEIGESHEVGYGKLMENKKYYKSEEIKNINISKEALDTFDTFLGQKVIKKNPTTGRKIEYEVIGIDEIKEMPRLALRDTSYQEAYFLSREDVEQEIKEGVLEFIKLEQKESIEQLSVPEEKLQEEESEKQEKKEENKFTVSREGNYPPQIQKKLEEIEGELRLNSENPELILNYAIVLSKISGKEKIAEMFFKQVLHTAYESKEEDKTIQAKIIYEYAKFLGGRRYFLFLVNKEEEKFGKDVQRIQMGETLSDSPGTGREIQDSKMRVKAIVRDALKDREHINDNTVLLNITSAYIKSNFSNKDISSSRYHLDKYLAEYPNNAKLLNIYGKFELLQENYNEAETYFQKSFDSDPENIENLFDYIDFNLQRGHFKESKKYFEMLLRYKPEDVDTLHKIAKIYKSLGDYKMALQYINDVLLLDPENSDAFISKAVLNYKMGNVAESEEEFKEALEKYKNNHNIYAPLEFAKIEAEKGNRLKAIEVLSRLYSAVRRTGTKNETVVLNTLGEIYAEEEKYTKKRNGEFEISLEKDKKNIITYNKYASVLAKSGNLIKAEALFKKAMELDSENTYTLHNYGKMLVNIEGRKEEGEFYISQAKNFGLE